LADPHQPGVGREPHDQLAHTADRRGGGADGLGQGDGQHVRLERGDLHPVGLRGDDTPDAGEIGGGSRGQLAGAIPPRYSRRAPTKGDPRDVVEAGGLMSYGVHFSGLCRLRSRALFGLIFLLAIAPAGPPIHAQQTSRIPKVGYLASANQAVAHLMAAFRQELRELGYVEGKTVLLEARFSERAADRFPQLAREMVALKPDVIVATNDTAIAAVRRETQTIPIVMAFSSDPAGAGFVASLRRPGGNVTGLSTLSPEISGKRLEL